jgi:hypothetical protein
MDKTLSVLDVGLKMEKNVVLYGPGGHGKSELALEFLRSKGITPYVITMGSGMTTDRMFGGMDIPVFEKTGKIEYLVENSFMNHEFVILEEMMDGPDFILEQLKDILSSGIFRNGTQIFEVKTTFIIACTNKTRDEFAKNDSLKALMERFPLEHNVVWPTYSETAYNTLLEAKFGKGQIDPIIPFLLEEYAKASITISPRIALDAYEIYEECGPDALMFIADFCKKPQLIAQTLKKYKSSIEFKKISSEIEEIINGITTNPGRSLANKKAFCHNYNKLKEIEKKMKGFSVTDDLAAIHAGCTKKVNEVLSATKARAVNYNENIVMQANIEQRTDAKLKPTTSAIEEFLDEEEEEENVEPEPAF